GSGQTLAGSAFLKKIVDFASLLGFIPLIYFAIKGAHWITQHLLWRLRRRLIVTYLLIGALPILLLILLIVLVGIVVVIQSNATLVLRQLDGYLEQSHAAAMSLSRDLSNWDLSRMDRDLLQRRLQERANVLAPVFPDLTLSLGSVESGGLAISVRGPSSEGANAQNLMIDAREKLPEWLRAENEFHGLVVEASPTGEKFVRARHIIKLKEPSPVVFQLIYPIGANLCMHIRHSTELEVKPGRVLTSVLNTTEGPQLEMDELTAFPSGSLPIYKRATSWSTGETKERDVLLLDTSFLLPNKIWYRVQQFKSGGGIGESIFIAIVGLAIFFLFIALLAIGSAVYLTRSITGAVHYLYAGTNRVESGDFEHEIPITGRDQLSALAVSFNRMTRSIRELLRVSADKQRLDQEMKIAAQVQSQLFPRTVPKTAKLDFAPGVCIPARSVSGDYYDYLDVAPGVVGIVVADVCGKGVSAALMMANLQANLRGQVQAYYDAYNFKLSLAAQSEPHDGISQVRQHSAELTPLSHPVQRIVERVNQQVADSIIDASYITLFYAEYDEKNSVLRYTNAGHNPPLLLRWKKSGEPEIERLERGGTVLGLFHDFVFEDSELKLESGDLLAAFTDGLIEARNPDNEEYGEERLISTIVRHSDLPAAEIENRILQSVRAWTSDAEQEDDLTLVIFKVK
ncbi:MAG: SpoIIE family protein phosphatase, partial [Acidobacteria bacterium]|nr:SpoIIE family protein phosphatase [Acidobacteriota bacterium]